MRIKILSFFYCSFRFITTNTIYFFQELFFKPKDLEPAVIVGDYVINHLTFLKRIIHEFPMPKMYSLNIHGLNFQSPLIGASFKSDKATLESWMCMGLGGLIFKTIMQRERYGNPKPHRLPH